MLLKTIIFNTSACLNARSDNGMLWYGAGGSFAQDKADPPEKKEFAPKPHPVEANPPSVQKRISNCEGNRLIFLHWF